MPRVADTNLLDGPDTAQPHSGAVFGRISGSDAPCSVQSLGTTASNPESFGDSGLANPDPWDAAHVAWRAVVVSATEATKRPRAPRTSDELHAASSVASQTPPEQSTADWTADLEYVWRVRTAALVEKLVCRARARRREARDATGGVKVKLLRSAEWAENRARALSMS